MNQIRQVRVQLFDKTVKLLNHQWQDIPEYPQEWKKVKCNLPNCPEHTQSNPKQSPKKRLDSIWSPNLPRWRVTATASASLPTQQQ